MKLVTLVAVAVTAASAADRLTVFGREWTVPVASDWKVEDGAQLLHLAEHRGPLPGPRRPIQFALTEVEDYGRMTFEADVKPLGSSLLIAFAYRDPAHFNYAHLSLDQASKQPVHNGIFHVYGGERVRISSERGPSSFSARGRWYHVKLTHDAAAGSVAVAVDGQLVPALQAVDLSLGPGQVGIGSFDETADFKNVKITVSPPGSATR